MSFSIAGLAVWLVLLLGGGVAGGALIIGFFASLPFGATAFATLSSLGGSSPLIYTLFAIAIIGAVAARREVLADIGRAFTQFPAAWLVCALAFYVAAGSYIFPRLFAGDTTAFIPIEGVVKELPLGPVSGNITQTAYFLLGVLLFIAFCVLLMRRETLRVVRLGLFTFVIMHVLLGAIDLAGKLAGTGDLLLPIRTANYALLTETEQSGFWRIVGGCPEASSFAAFGLSALAFSFTYWREAGSRLALLLASAMLILLLLSTSSTAYVGCTVLICLALLSVGRGALRDRLKPQDLVLVVAGLALLALMLGVLPVRQPPVPAVPRSLADHGAGKGHLVLWPGARLLEFAQPAIVPRYLRVGRRHGQLALFQLDRLDLVAARRRRIGDGGRPYRATAARDGKTAADPR